MQQNEGQWTRELSFLTPLYPVAAFSDGEVRFLRQLAATFASHKARGATAAQLQSRLSGAVLDRLLWRELGVGCAMAREAAHVVMLLAVVGLHGVKYSSMQDFARMVSGPGRPFEATSLSCAKAADLCTFANWLDIGVKYVQILNPRSAKLLRDVCVRLVRGHATEPDLGGASDLDFDVLLEFLLQPQVERLSLRAAHAAPGGAEPQQMAAGASSRKEDIAGTTAVSPTTSASTDASELLGDTGKTGEESEHQPKKPRHTLPASTAKTRTVCSAQQPVAALSSERVSEPRNVKRARVSTAFDFFSARVVPPV